MANTDPKAAADKATDDTTKSGKAADAEAEKANAEVQAKVDEETERGYRGSVPDERPNSDYSLQSGPDAPELADQYREARNT